ncbi:hypothetical protein [Fuchsiella alkaliacetigena]|uniref:hypothetical protein n=1 Tax=Fuchsiella alkaliacetigena TaxID=957042 RepID=UPI00200A9AF6|nr:hypothetical protein [Fuchsiella alkaliacetigena]MCK8825906.1 hypothetical protein [Fuchsiella alkaliacetigena]
MQQGYNLMTQNYNQQYYQDDDFVERMSIMKFLKMVQEENKYIDYSLEIYGLEEFLCFLGKEDANDLLTEILGKGVNYLTDNFATIKVITENKIVIWNNKAVLKYSNEEFPLGNIFGSSLRQEDTEYWVANLNIDS